MYIYSGRETRIYHVAEPIQYIPRTYNEGPHVLR